MPGQSWQQQELFCWGGTGPCASGGWCPGRRAREDEGTGGRGHGRTRAWEDEGTAPRWEQPPFGQLGAPVLPCPKAAECNPVCKGSCPPVCPTASCCPRWGRCQACGGVGISGVKQLPDFVYFLHQLSLNSFSQCSFHEPHCGRN